MANFSKFDERMFEKARETAETSDFDHFHLGCVITYKHHIISTGANGRKTHPIQKYYNKRYRYFRKGSKPCIHTLHAEMAALAAIPYPLGLQLDWRDVNVYIYRISPGKPSGHGLARPCPACLAALRQAGVRNLYYTGEDSFVYERLAD
jgi:deoxycytidylate deaminase